MSDETYKKMDAELKETKEKFNKERNSQRTKQLQLESEKQELEVREQLLKENVN